MNGSAVVSAAFEAKLAEIASNKETKVMNRESKRMKALVEAKLAEIESNKETKVMNRDSKWMNAVVERLRKSNKKAEEQTVTLGRNFACDWVETVAEAMELKRLARYVTLVQLGDF